MKTIELSKGKIALVDDEDYERVNHFSWFANLVNVKSERYRAARNKNDENEFMYMHQFIMGNRIVDHIDNDSLNNQKANLRVCTIQQNCMNSKKKRENATSKFKCVSWERKRKIWEAYIKIDYKKIFLGYFKKEEDAARAYDKKAKELFGEFAFLNFPELKELK